MNDGLLEIQLAVSRDGVRFQRPDRTPYIPLDVKGTWHAGQMYMGGRHDQEGKQTFPIL